jgi:hypothetical protein
VPARGGGAFATIADVIQSRRLSALLVGAWLGASILTDIAVTQNFQAVDRFLAAPGDPGTSAEIKSIGAVKMRAILRRNAGEENNWIFLNFERAEFILGGVLFLVLLFGDRPQKLMLALSLAMLAIVGVEHFFLAPRIAEAGRIIDDLPASAPERSQFWMLHGAYSGLDILKMLIGFVFAVRLAMKRKPDKEVFAREFAMSAGKNKISG